LKCAKLSVIAAADDVPRTHSGSGSSRVHRSASRAIAAPYLVGG
jgi:hypothetical protein